MMTGPYVGKPQAFNPARSDPVEEALSIDHYAGRNQNRKFREIGAQIVKAVSGHEP
jgi:hypothetical protein